jgi:hypothetical protein
MSVAKEKKIKKRTRSNNDAVSPKVKDYGNDPFFVKKAKEAEAFIRKYGLPSSSSR